MKLFIFTILTISLLSSPSLAISPQKPYQQQSTKFIRTSCITTTYPTLCYSSLAKHAASIQTNRLILTNTALNVTLASAKYTSALMSTLSKNRRVAAREVAALRDCVEVVGDSVDELRRSISEMGRVGGPNFFEPTIMSDVQTWVSAALTDESTCIDGFEGTMNSEVKTIVRTHIVRLAHLTSNALAFINQLASLHA
ncbi:21 kDa protein [Senna tora]|uniref:pectinesterase n=1 Tax=Senna tora TaxID=362788 RepID=A0A834TNY3_9FABA|nr:21 kDa protein [Senna tora]